MTDQEEQEEDDESTDGELRTCVESWVITSNLRRSKCGWKHLKDFGQNIYEQWLFYWFTMVLKSRKEEEM